MPRYEVRRYYTYVDTYVVESAEDEHEAEDKVTDAEDTQGNIAPDNPQGVKQTGTHEDVSYTDSAVVEIDEHGAEIAETVFL
jgi:hypothetical protein